MTGGAGVSGPARPRARVFLLERRPQDVVAVRLTVRGVVQGVGMRPFVYRTARRHGVRGWVLNSSRGVVIEAEGREQDVRAFVRALSSEAPPLARVESVEEEPIVAGGLPEFEIRTSRAESEESTLICPDVAICADCLREFLDPADRRSGYPFINCTNCGPRYSIIRDTPYDRPATSMAPFRMCDRCQSEYDDPLDRRFHAQPNACPECGPAVRLVTPAGPHERAAELVLGRSYCRVPGGLAALEAMEAARWLLKKGALIGVRGLGGFHLAANAEDEHAVRSLREKKNRPAKPFAVMCRSVEVARELAEIDDVEAGILGSPWSPVVLLRKRHELARRISELVAPNNAYLGIMLPYAPLHHLLFDDELAVLIMTSANPPGEPLVSTVEEALSRLPEITRTFVDHNRDVVNRNDDSVVYAEGGRSMMSRRSRGYAPYPIDLHTDTVKVLACGTELKNTFTMLKDGWAFVSPHVGDLENQETLTFYEETVRKFERWFRVEPEIVACDLHPDYLATRFAKRYSNERDLPLVEVQHHHAHVAAAAAENDVRGSVIGLALDGTGYGSDGAIWGCEFILADLAGFERAGHLKYVPLPGGDAAIRHPHRVALSHMWAAGVDGLLGVAERLFDDVPADELDLVAQQIEKRINTVDTSSAGRLFDAVSAILGICRHVSYEAQAAIELESAADPSVERAYPYAIAEEGGLVVDAGPIVRAVLEEASAGVARHEISGAFHNTMVRLCLDVATRLADAHGARPVALSGGVFQNRLLLRRLLKALEDSGFEVILPRETPVNDGGVSLGQAVVANERRRRGKL